jgi:hypothetical protein
LHLPSTFSFKPIRTIGISIWEYPPNERRFATYQEIVPEVETPIGTFTDVLRLTIDFTVVVTLPAPIGDQEYQIRGGEFYLDAEPFLAGFGMRRKRAVGEAESTHRARIALFIVDHVDNPARIQPPPVKTNQNGDHCPLGDRRIRMRSRRYSVAASVAP